MHIIQLQPFQLLLLIVTAFSFGSCTSPEQKAEKKVYQDKVVIRQRADPKGLNPFTDSDAQAADIRRYLFQKLLTIDQESLELVPYMAASLPELVTTGDSEEMLINYELKKGMTWDNGAPITPRDVEFSFMCAKNSKVDAAHIRPYVEFLVDFKYDKSNPLKFQLVCKSPYMLWDHVTGTEVSIISESFYDPEGLLKDRHLNDFVDEDAEFIQSDTNREFARNFNDVKFKREEDFIYGSGAYKQVSWQTNQRVILKRKKTWWGDKFANEMALFQAGPETIVFETINDNTTALTALKAEKIDILPGIRSADYLELPNSKKAMANFNLHVLDNLSYTYLGMNIKNPLWRGLKTRKAMAHLVNAKQMEETLLNNMGRRTIGPIHPLLEKDYNKDIEPYQFDVELARKLLKEDGWEDSDGDGILDKVIDGKRQAFKVNFLGYQGNETVKNFALMIKESVKLAGIDLSLSTVEWSVYLERKKAKQIDLWLGAWSMDARPLDPVQIWHTKSAYGGSNDSNFGDAASDALIKKIREEFDPEARSILYHEWQELLHEQVPYVFLFCTTRKFAVHKRLENLNFGLRHPGYWGGGIQVK